LHGEGKAVYPRLGAMERGGGNEVSETKEAEKEQPKDNQWRENTTKKNKITLKKSRH
jgi:hypothetical protein